LRIKKLDIVGFKSFKDRTVIHFDAGITGVVGPNGCGKSNIVDALVWVMGEMSAKHLRGSSMEDVIFAGAEGYAPMGMAEVSLTLENDGGPFPVKYLNHSEIMLTRRLHRSGESEYLINRESARLRDIQEVFMDTGAGSKGFSIIEQGAIGKIVTAKPEDRRSLIEEAAGITKFKARKRESQRKLKATEANLIRLQDIIGELKRQLDSLQRQAQRAERYRNLKNEIEEIDLWVSSKEFVDLKEKTDSAQANFDSAQAQEAEASSGLGSVESKLAELRQFTLEKEKSIEEFRAELQSNQQGVREREGLLQELKFEIEQAKRSKEMAGSIFQENQVREQALLDDFNKTQERLKEVTEAESSLSLTYGDQKEIYEQKRERIQAWDDELSEKRRGLLTATGAENQVRSKYQSSEESIAELEEKYSGAKEALLELESEKEVLEKNQNQIHQAFEKERQMQLEIMNDVETFVSNRDLLVAQMSEKSGQVDEYKDKLNEVTSRLYGLENMRDNLEGFQAGTKSVMSWQSEKLAGVPESEREDRQVFKPLADIVQVQEDYEVALEATLGPKMQMLLSSDATESVKAVDYLKEQKSGRSTFYSAQGAMETHDGSESSLLKNARGVKCFLQEVVQVAEPFRGSLQSLVDNVVVVESIHNGVELSGQFPAWTFVTQEGDVLTKDGVLSGGFAEDAHSGLLQRQREIRELQLAKEEWSGKLALATAAFKKLEAQVEQMTEDLERAQKDKTEKEILVAGLKKDLERAEAESDKARRAQESHEKELDSQDERLNAKKADLENLKTHLAELVEKKETLEARIEELGSSLDGEKLGIEDLQSEVTRLQVETAKRQQEKLGVEAEHGRLGQALADVRSQMEKMGAEETKNVQFMTENQVEMEQKKVELELLIQKVEAQEKQLATMRDEFEREQKETYELQESISGQLAQKSQMQTIMNESQLILEQSRMKQENLVEQFREKYLKELSEVAAEIALKEGNLEDSAKQLKVLKERIGRIGEVNLSAIEEYDELVDRYEFLKKQYDDLIDAKDQLGKVIDRINRICSKRFRETFDAVNSRFQRVFPVLFGGGEARLILIEDPEKDELGIDIVSKPPGKKLQSVSLLSGGEKALTAVSLIFSIFLVKPSPYCLLDEVDAPLDDANVMRFNDLVREMAKRSQIIVVTHNKFTMEIAEKLYGVTMEEKGVSKMVSVDLHGAKPPMS